jgi:type IV fimbrial biogenesis protein FimT
MLGTMKPPTMPIRSRRGLTMVEVLVTLAIAAILISVAVPSMLGFLDRQRVISITAEMVTDLRLARSETVKRNQAIEMSFDGDGSQTCYVIHTTDTAFGDCNCTRAAGAVCVDAGGNAVANLTDLKTVQLPRSQRVTVASNQVAYKFMAPTGMPQITDGMQVDVSSPRGGQLRVTTNAVGRPTVCSPNSSIPGYPPC